MDTVSILIADDHELVRDGIRARLEQQPGWAICAETDNGRDAVALAISHQARIAVLDIGMPALNGIDAARQIRVQRPETEVLILTLQDSEEQVRAALQAGVRGYMLKTDAGRFLVEAISALLRGQAYFSGTVARQVLHDYLKPAADHVGRLTSREREIIQLLAEAKTNRDVAHVLGVSVKTVDAHRSNIMRKLNLHSVAELVRFAIRHRIVEP